MGVWKTGWCIGAEIERYSASMQQEELNHFWFTDDIYEVENHLDNIFAFLSKEDYDIVYLYFLIKKKQADICQLLKRTQPAVCYDIKRVKRHIDFVIYLLSVVDRFIDFINNEEHGLTKEQSNILILMFFSTSFTKTSQVMLCHQITCRSKFDKILIYLREKGYEDIVEIFETILNNLNMIKKTVVC